MIELKYWPQNAKRKGIASMTHVDGDGASDLVVGAPYHNAGGVQDAGKVYLAGDEIA